MSKDTPKGNIRLYLTGGCGINIGMEFLSNKAEDGYANIHPAIIDTSSSNLKEEIDDDIVYLIDGLDGSGKVRQENVGPITNNINKLLLNCKPMDFNIVVFGGAGGERAA